MAIVYQIYQGDTLKLDITVVDKDGVAVDLTGATLRFSLSSPVPITEETVGVTITSTVLGEINLNVSDEVMDTVAVGAYLFEVSVEYPDGVVETLFVEAIKVLRGA
jgi:hypothetical protein